MFKMARLIYGQANYRNTGSEDLITRIANVEYDQNAAWKLPCIFGWDWLYMCENTTIRRCVFTLP